jgi:hypothetical protein
MIPVLNYFVFVVFQIVTEKKHLNSKSNQTKHNVQKIESIELIIFLRMRITMTLIFTLLLGLLQLHHVQSQFGCHPHQYQYDQTYCIDCERDSYSPGGGATTCYSCLDIIILGSDYPSGSEYEKWKTLCDSGCSNSTVAVQFSNGDLSCDCNPGYVDPFNSSVGNTTKQCNPCPAGKFSNDDGSQCIDCAQGKFSGASGASACDNCDTGKYANASGQSVCSSCPMNMEFDYYENVCVCAGGYQFDTTFGSCTPCSAGSYSHKGSECTFCDIGKYSDQSGMTYCPGCDAGKFSALYGSSYCLLCSPGSISLGGAGSCSLCSPGKYTSTYGNAYCENCPSGRYADTSIGSSHCSYCAGDIIEGTCFPNSPSEPAAQSSNYYAYWVPAVVFFFVGLAIRLFLYSWCRNRIQQNRPAISQYQPIPANQPYPPYQPYPQPGYQPHQPNPQVPRQTPAPP